MHTCAHTSRREEQLSSSPVTSAPCSKPSQRHIYGIWRKPLNPSCVSIPQTCGCLPVGADRVPAVNSTCTAVGAAAFGGQLPKPSVLKAARLRQPGPGFPAPWPPKPPLGARVHEAWAERIRGKVCAPRGDGGGADGGGDDGRRRSEGRPVAPCGSLPVPTADRRRRTPGKLRLCRRQPPVRREPARRWQPFWGQILAKVVLFCPRAAPDPIGDKCNSLDLACRVTLSGPASLPGPAPRPTRAPDGGLAAAGARGGREQAEGRLGRPRRSPAPLNKGESLAPAGNPRSQREGKTVTPTTAAPSPSP